MFREGFYGLRAASLVFPDRLHSFHLTGQSFIAYPRSGPIRKPSRFSWAFRIAGQPPGQLRKFLVIDAVWFRPG